MVRPIASRAVHIILILSPSSIPYILIIAWLGGQYGEIFSFWGWQYWPDRREGQYITWELNISPYCPTQGTAIIYYMTFNGAMATDFVYLNPFEFEEWSTQSVASYKRGYGNNEHVATAWLLSVELKCWFLAQLVSSTLLSQRAWATAWLTLTYSNLAN